MAGTAALGSARSGRHEFLLLDGLRGVAALAVLVFHMGDWFVGGRLFLHGYIAVDFFFVLSGFVIAHAYSDALTRPGGIKAYAWARVVRLYPLLWLGTVAGLVVYLLRVHAEGVPLDRVVLANCLASLVPFPALWANDLFPVDPPVWSLFWELVVNVVFALVLHRLRTAWLVMLAILLAAALIAHSASSGSIELGPFRKGWEFGGVRAFYGFILGMLLLRRLRAAPPQRRTLQLWTVVAVIVMLTGFPLHGAFSIGYDLVLVILINPLVVFAAARSAPIVPQVEAWSGAMSYPLYIIHGPILILLGGIMTRLHVADRAPKWLLGLVIAAIIIALSVAIDRWFDVPLRRYLRRRSV